MIVPAAVNGNSPGRQAEAGVVAACRKEKTTIAARDAESGVCRAKSSIHSATTMKVTAPAAHAITRCAPPTTGSASRPASARKTKLKKKSGARASAGTAEIQKEIPALRIRRRRPPPQSR